MECWFLFDKILVSKPVMITSKRTHPEYKSSIRQKMVEVTICDVFIILVMSFVSFDPGPRS